MIYKYLVASALQEELEEFLKLMNATFEIIELGVRKSKFAYDSRQIEILTFTGDKMGMPYTAATLMQVVKHFSPQVTLFIGTCASLKTEHPLGSVLVPHVVFTYESGKYEKGEFKPDYYSFHTDDDLRRESASLRSRKSFNYSVVTDEDFCTGAAVINDSEKVDHIPKGRKVSGLDMEAYSVACINHVLRPKNQLLVIKGISDYAKKKEEAETTGNKQLAKENSSHFALQLIKHLEDIGYCKEVVIPISIKTRIGENPNAYYKLKVLFDITNLSNSPVMFHSLSFQCHQSVQIDPEASATHHKPMIKVGEEKTVDNKIKDIYDDTYIIHPGKSTISCWIPLDPTISKSLLQQKLVDQRIGTWQFRCFVSAPNGSHALNFQEKIRPQFPN